MIHHRPFAVRVFLQLCNTCFQSQDHTAHSWDSDAWIKLPSSMTKQGTNDRAVSFLRSPLNESTTSHTQTPPAMPAIPWERHDWLQVPRIPRQSGQNFIGKVVTPPPTTMSQSTPSSRPPLVRGCQSRHCLDC